MIRRPIVTPRGTWYRHRRPWFQGGLRLVAPIALLVAINIFVFFFRDTGSIAELLKGGGVGTPPAYAAAVATPSFWLGQDARAAAHGQYTARPPVEQPLGAASTNGQAPASGLAANASRLVGATEQLPVVVKGSLSGHRGLRGALGAARVEERDAQSLIKALASQLDLRTLRADQRFVAALDRTTGRVLRFVYHVNSMQRIEVSRRDGAFTVTKREIPVEVRQAAIAARVEGSLEEAVAATGESRTLLYRLLQLFSWDVNWSTDVRRGDELRVIAEKRYVEGRFVGYGKILAAQYEGKRAGKATVYHYERSDRVKGYYDGEGRAITRPLLKTPVSYRRISSQFSRRRFHPILRRVKAHLGVDYAAPVGTPVWAAGDGRIVWAKWAGPAGKMVQIRHDSGVITAYMHLSRIAKGLRFGKRVKQRQIIGYVGTTGRSTGPHLHYGMKVNGRYIDPLDYDVPRGPLLARGERTRFRAGIAPLTRQLEQLAPGVPPSAAKATPPSPTKSSARVPALEIDIWS